MPTDGVGTAWCNWPLRVIVYGMYYLRDFVWALMIFYLELLWVPCLWTYGSQLCTRNPIDSQEKM